MNDPTANVSAEAKQVKLSPNPAVNSERKTIKLASSQTSSKSAELGNKHKTDSQETSNEVTPNKKARTKVTWP